MLAQCSAAFIPRPKRRAGLEEPIDDHIPHAGSHRKNFVRHSGRKRHERSGLWRNIERLRPIDAEGATLALLACACEEHHD
jgi:hypothetical protein